VTDTNDINVIMEFKSEESINSVAHESDEESEILSKPDRRRPSFTMRSNSEERKIKLKNATKKLKVETCIFRISRENCLDFNE